MSESNLESSDARAGAYLVASGGAILALALRSGWSPQSLNPGLDGTLSVTLAGFLFALLHPLPFRACVLLSAPTTLALVLASAYAGGWSIGLGLGSLQLLAMGVTGLLVGVRSASRVPSPAPSFADRGRDPDGAIESRAG